VKIEASRDRNAIHNVRDIRTLVDAWSCIALRSLTLPARLKQSFLVLKPLINLRYLARLGITAVGIDCIFQFQFPAFLNLK
jgi:hypothetical protein